MIVGLAVYFLIAGLCLWLSYSIDREMNDDKITEALFWPVMVAQVFIAEWFEAKRQRSRNEHRSDRSDRRD